MSDHARRAPDRSTVAFGAHIAFWSLVGLVLMGLASAIIPNPAFGREIAPEPFSLVVWMLSAPLIGIVFATYSARPPAGPAVRLRTSVDAVTADDRGGTLGMVGGIAAFLAIGCPVCNKIVLVALGTTGALTVWAPLQPLIGAASIGLLAATAVWRLRIRARGGACSTI